MHTAVELVKTIVGWGDNSVTTDSREKLVVLLAGLGLTGSSLAKDILTRTSASELEKYITTIQSYLLRCKPLENDPYLRRVCGVVAPLFPSMDKGEIDNILTGVSGCYQALIIFMLLRNTIRVCTAQKEQSSDFDYTHVSISSEAQENESSSLLAKESSSYTRSAVNLGKNIIGWGDNSVTSGHWEKLAVLLGGLGLTGTSIAKDVLTRAGAEEVEEYIINVQGYLLHCKFLDNEHSRLVCGDDVPKFSSTDNVNNDDLLTGFSGFFEAIIIFILIRGVIKICTAKKQPPSNSIPNIPANMWESSDSR